MDPGAAARLGSRVGARGSHSEDVRCRQRLGLRRGRFQTDNVFGEHAELPSLGLRGLQGEALGGGTGTKWELIPCLPRQVPGGQAWDRDLQSSHQSQRVVTVWGGKSQTTALKGPQAQPFGEEHPSILSPLLSSGTLEDNVRV